jgi:adenylate kinase
LNIVFIGAPGSGKGTQSREFIEKHSFVQLSTGDLLRSSISQGTSLGLKAKSFMDEGKLVPDQVMIGIVDDFLNSQSGKSVIFDGFPRTVEQAKYLDSMLLQKDNKLKNVFYFKIDPSVLIERLTGRRVCSNCGEIYHIKSKPSKVVEKCDLCDGVVVHRSDDYENVITERLSQFEKNTGPTIDYYRSNGLLIEIDSAQKPSLVFEQIQKTLAFN